MQLDKCDLCHARATFLETWPVTSQLDGDYEWCLDELRRGRIDPATTILGVMRARILAARPAIPSEARP